MRIRILFGEVERNCTYVCVCKNFTRKIYKKNNTIKK